MELGAKEPFLQFGLSSVQIDLSAFNRVDGSLDESLITRKNTKIMFKYQHRII